MLLSSKEVFSSRRNIVRVWTLNVPGEVGKPERRGVEQALSGVLAHPRLLMGESDKGGIWLQSPGDPYLVVAPTEASIP